MSKQRTGRARKTVVALVLAGGSILATSQPASAMISHSKCSMSEAYACPAPKDGPECYCADGSY
ncbi:MAG TPA: hypothetical protein VHJ78_02400 [Actinomycetota bacterium]|nr:hypothetical protein [Actinomycetota bacterium]